MLLFSTKLSIQDSMTKDAFIRLVIDWNQGSPHPDNRIGGLSWNGERNIRFGSDSLWLAIEEYRNRNVIAVRYEKTEPDGAVWDTDYIMNFDEMKMAIQLDRSYLEEALEMNASFSTPFFISSLIDSGYLKDDGDLPVLSKPVFISNGNLELLADVINGKRKYSMPVVYVSKTYGGKDPVNIWRLSERLKGVAHVLVQESPALNARLRKLCSDENEYYGAIGVYYPGASGGHQKYLFREYEGADQVLMEKVIRGVILYCNSYRMDKLYTWQGVSNSLLMDKLDSRGQMLQAAETRQQQMEEETSALMGMADEDIQKLRKQVEELTRVNEALTYENLGLRTKIDSMGAVPVLYLGKEDEFFPGEIRAMLLEALEEQLKGTKAKSRRADVLKDVIKSNPCERTAGEKAKKVKDALRGYKNMTVSIKQLLSEMGFVITEDGKHYKLTYFGDPRYWTTVAKTSSDRQHGGDNVSKNIINYML